jgi:8-oxo-dGTP pyrophosphatase MutT (NUDIX family)
MLRRSPLKRYAAGVVHPVGGKLELNEDAFEGAKREVLEEAGVHVKNLRLEAVLNEILPPPHHDHNWLIYHFSADMAGGEVGATDEGELVWLSVEQIKAEKLFPSLGLVINQVLDPAVGTVFATIPWNGERMVEPGAVINLCAR